MSTYLFIRRFKSAPWLILNGAGSRSICSHGYLGAATLAIREVNEIVHLLRKVRRRRYRARPLMNAYCRLDLGSGERRREENE